MKYIYRPEIASTVANAMDLGKAQQYDYLYQRCFETGAGIPWQCSTWFTSMAMEEGLAIYKARRLVHDIDQWIANFMLQNQAFHEAHGHAMSHSRGAVRIIIARRIQVPRHGKN